MKGFRDFLMRGNLVELAVAFIMGAAFSAVVTSFTQIIMDVINKIVGGKADFSSVSIAGINIGVFVTALVSFVLVAIVVYFLLVKPFTALQARLNPPAQADEPTEAELLTQIRDLLAQQGGATRAQ
jgi:large conductance mechanosensitive channel